MVTGTVFNGANDNASGTAALLELARESGKEGMLPAGDEAGLHGTPQLREPVGHLHALGQETSRGIVGPPQHGRELRHAELIDRRRPLTRERLRRGEARLRVLRVGQVEVGPMDTQSHQAEVGLVGRLLLRLHRTQQLGRGVRQRGSGGVGHGPIAAGTTDNAPPETGLSTTLWTRLLMTFRASGRSGFETGAPERLPQPAGGGNPCRIRATGYRPTVART